MKFVKDSLTQMNAANAEGTKYEFTDADFEQFFTELDKDASGTIDKGEMFLFIQKVITGKEPEKPTAPPKRDPA